MTRQPEPFRSLGFAAIDWVEHFLVHGPGDVQGQQVVLDDEFAAFVLRAYEVDSRGGRKVRRAFLSRAKGRSKSGLAAFIACFEALGPARFDHWAVGGEVSEWGYEFEVGEPVGRPLTYVEVLCVATEEGQAGNTYDAIHYMLNPDRCSVELLEFFGKLDVGLTRINLPDARGFIEPVTSADKSADGGKSTFIVADETHLWVLPRLKRLHGIMTRNLLKRRAASGWMLETSTMYADGEGSVAEGTHTYAKTAKDGKLLFDHRQAGDGWDLTKRDQRVKALVEAYGPAADWMDLGVIADSWDDPQVSEPDFRRYWLNQPVALVAPTPLVMPNWLNLITGERSTADAIGVAVSIDRAWSSVGGASSDGYVGAFHHRRGVDWVVSEVVSMQEIRRCDVVVDGKSPAASLIADLEAAGVPVTVASLEDYVQACADFYDATEGDTLTHSNDPVLTEAVQVATKRAVGDRWAWGRKLSDISMLEAVTLARWGATTNVSVYETRDMVFL